MNKFKRKSIKEICKEIDLIIAGEDNKIDYKYIYMHLDAAFTRRIKYDDIVLICETILKIAKTKNRIIRHLEKSFWDFVDKIPFHIILIQGHDISENEELLSNTDYDIPDKKILSRLIGLALDVMELKDDNSKGSDLRRSGSLRLLGEMVNYYHIPIAKKMFVNSINRKNKQEQYQALQGLENYYDVTEDEIEDDLLKIIEGIETETDDRTIASTCLQIQINAGVIDEMTALYEIGDWKDAHDDDWADEDYE